MAKLWDIEVKLGGTLKLAYRTEWASGIDAALHSPAQAHFEEGRELELSEVGSLTGAVFRFKLGLFGGMRSLEYLGATKPYRGWSEEDVFALLSGGL